MPAENSYGGAAGTGSTSQLYFGGDQPPGSTTNSFKYDGTAWTANASLANARNTLGGFGTATAALASCGNQSSPGASEEYNNSINTITPGAWASSNNMGTARRNVAGAGIQTSALAIGGEAPRTGKTELYNGSTWSEVNDLNTARNTLGASGTSVC